MKSDKFEKVKNIPKRYSEELAELFSSKKRIAVIGHHNPDGDAVGGSLGLYIVFKNAGFDVSIIMPSELTEFLLWLPDSEDIVIYDKDKDKASQLLLKAEIIICVDFNEAERVGNAQEALKKSEAVKILIDHHPNPGTDTDYIFSFTEYSSASEIVYEFIELVDFKQYIDKDVASCIYTGIMTDTLNFSVNSSREETFKIVAELLSFGIKKDKIYDNVYNNFSVDRLKLIGYILYKKMKIIKGVDFSYMIITKEEMEEFNFIDGDHEGIVNMPLSVSDINASIIAIEKDDFIKVSLRSKKEIDVNSLSKRFFNGGGHKNAAGGKIYKKIEDTESYIIDSVKTFFKLQDD